MLDLLQKGQRRRPTIVSEMCEIIPHNCDGGHTWTALMFPPIKTRKGDKWRYANTQQQWCPVCGRPQSDEEPIV
jgi:hypothetical protein